VAFGYHQGAPEPSPEPDPANIGLCIWNAQSGVMIGQVAGVGINPAFDAAAYRVAAADPPPDSFWIRSGSMGPCP
jgi:hypothetical protein